MQKQNNSSDKFAEKLSMQRRKKWDYFMFCLFNISDLGWQNDVRKNPEMSLVWINLHHLEAGGSIL